MLFRSIEKYPKEIACVILEPMNLEWPKENFLNEVLELCEKNGIVCVFDETITGFRYSKGGAQEIFNVKPHLTTFGKGIANGFPLSVIGGKAEIMNEMENIFFSGTFGGELVSLAAANFVLNQHLEDLIAPELHRRGSLLDSSFNDILLKNNMSEYV